MSKPVQKYEPELGLSQASKLKGNADRVQRGKTPPYVFPSGYYLLGSSTTPPSGFSYSNLKTIIFDSTQSPTATYYYLHRKP